MSIESIKTIARRALGVVEYPFTHTFKFLALLDECIVDEPPIKLAVENLVKAGMLAISDGTAAVAGKGLNIPADLAEVKDVESFFTYFKGTFLPLVESEYKQLNKTATAA